MTDSKDTIAANLCFLMERAGMSQHELARRSGCGQKTISYAVNAQKSATAATLQALSKPLGVEAWQLLAPVAWLTRAPHTAELLARYQAADSRGRDVVLQTARIATPDYKK